MNPAAKSHIIESFETFQNRNPIHLHYKEVLFLNFKLKYLSEADCLLTKSAYLNKCYLIMVFDVVWYFRMCPKLVKGIKAKLKG